MCKSRPASLSWSPESKGPLGHLADKWAPRSVAPPPTLPPSPRLKERESELGGTFLEPPEILCIFPAGGTEVSEGGRALYPHADVQSGREIKVECLGQQGPSACFLESGPPSAPSVSPWGLPPPVPPPPGAVSEGLGLRCQPEGDLILRQGGGEPRPHSRGLTAFSSRVRHLKVCACDQSPLHTIHREMRLGGARDSQGQGWV